MDDGGGKPYLTAARFNERHGQESEKPPPYAETSRRRLSGSSWQVATTFSSRGELPEESGPFGACGPHSLRCQLACTINKTPFYPGMQACPGNEDSELASSFSSSGPAGRKSPGFSLRPASNTPLNTIPSGVLRRLTETAGTVSVWEVRPTSHPQQLCIRLLRFRILTVRMRQMNSQPAARASDRQSY